MNKKFIGSDVFDGIETRIGQNPQLKVDIEECLEKKEIAYLLKRARLEADISQKELAAMTKVPASVISRIESKNATVLPRFNLLTKLFGAMGYRMSIQLEKA